MEQLGEQKIDEELEQQMEMAMEYIEIGLVVDWI